MMTGSRWNKALQAKWDALVHALNGAESTPECVTAAMLTCGNNCDQAELLVRERSLWNTLDMQGPPAGPREAPEELREQLNALEELLREKDTAAAAARLDPFLAASVLCWAMDEGDIPLDAPDELVAALTGAIGREIRRAVEAQTEDRYVEIDLWETATCVFGLGGMGSALAGAFWMGGPLMTPVVVGAVMVFVARLMLVASAVGPSASIRIEKRSLQKSCTPAYAQALSNVEDTQSNYA